MRSKYERFCSEMERAQEWMHRNEGISRDSTKSVCIFVADDDKEGAIAFTGDIKAMFELHERIKQMIAETIIKIALEETED